MTRRAEEAQSLAEQMALADRVGPDRSEEVEVRSQGSRRAPSDPVTPVTRYQPEAGHLHQSKTSAFTKGTIGGRAEPREQYSTGKVADRTGDVPTFEKRKGGEPGAKDNIHIDGLEGYGEGGYQQG